MTEGQRSFAMVEEKLIWFAVYTRPRWEKKVARLLEEIGVEFYCPLTKVERQWSDRKKIILEPVFKSYIFVRVADTKKWNLREVPGIVNFVYSEKKPAVIRPEEIDIIKKFLNEFKEVKVHPVAGLKVNSRVRVTQGLMMDYHGVLVELIGKRAVVRFDSMGMQMEAQIERQHLELFAQGQEKISE